MSRDGARNPAAGAGTTGAELGIRSATAEFGRVHPHVQDAGDTDLFIIGFVEDRVLLVPISASADTRSAYVTAKAGKIEEGLKRAG